MQSFAPLFLILLIKYFDLKLFHLCKKFSDIVLNNPIYALTKVVNHSAFVTLILELFCLLYGTRGQVLETRDKSSVKRV